MNTIIDSYTNSNCRYMVMVIISNGIPSKPIIPKIKKAAIKLGTTPIKDKVKFLNSIKNIIKIPTITKPSVKI